MKSFVPRGFAIISALFILVVLAMLGAFVVNISGAQHLGSAQDLLGARAAQAARAGIEWGLYQVNIVNAAGKSGGTACPAASTNLAMPAAATTLSGMSVTVLCSPGAAVSGNYVYKIVATACNQPNAAGASCPNITSPTELYVERQIEIFLQSW